mgnify:CR=1 FL=1
MEAMIAAAAFKAVGSIQQGIAQSNASKFNAKVAEQNAVLARTQAAEQARLRRVQGRKDTGAARAAYGASGVAFSGSPIDAIEEGIFATEMDAAAIEQRGRYEEASLLNQAKLNRYAAKNQRIQGFLNAAGGLAGASNGSGGSLWSSGGSSSSITWNS